MKMERKSRTKYFCHGWDLNPPTSLIIDSPANPQFLVFRNSIPRNCLFRCCPAEVRQVFGSVYLVSSGRRLGRCSPANLLSEVPDFEVSEQQVIPPVSSEGSLPPRCRRTPPGGIHDPSGTVNGLYSPLQTFMVKSQELTLLHGTFLTGTFLTGTFLAGTYLTGTFLNGNFLTGTYLTGTFLIGTFLTGTFLNGNFLTGTYLTGTFLIRTFLTGTFLTESFLTGTYTLLESLLTGTFLTGTFLTATATERGEKKCMVFKLNCTLLQEALNIDLFCMKIELLSRTTIRAAALMIAYSRMIQRCGKLAKAT